METPLTPMCEGRINRGTTFVAGKPCLSFPLTQDYVKTYSSCPRLPGSKLPSAVSSVEAFQPWAFLSVRDNRLLLFFLAIFLGTTIITFFSLVKDISVKFTVLPKNSYLSIFYSTLFKDSTMSIFFSLKCMAIFTTAENPQVNKALYTKLKGRITLPNITASTSTVVITYR